MGLLRRLGFDVSEGEVTAPAPAACLILKERGLRPHLLVHDGRPAGPWHFLGWGLGEGIPLTWAKPLGRTLVTPGFCCQHSWAWGWKAHGPHPFSGLIPQGLLGQVSDRSSWENPALCFSDLGWIKGAGNCQGGKILASSGSGCGWKERLKR